MAADRGFGALGAAVAVTAGSSASSASTALPGGQAANAQFAMAGGQSCKITNTIAFPVAYAFSATNAVATATGPNGILAANESRVVSMPPDTQFCAAYGIGGTGSVYFQRGDGGV